MVFNESQNELHLVQTEETFNVTGWMSTPLWARKFNWEKDEIIKGLQEGKLRICGGITYNKVNSYQGLQFVLIPLPDPGEKILTDIIDWM